MTQKEIIVECAAKMFVTQGVKAVRMDDIAQALSVSKRTLYELFGDKEELLYQSIRHFSLECRRRRLEASKSIDNELEVMLTSIRDMVSTAPEVRRMRRNMQRFYPAVYERLEKDSQVNSDNDLKEWIERCIEKGYMTETSNCDFILRVLKESVQGIMVIENGKEAPDSIELISMISYSLVIFIRGLCTKEGIDIIDNCYERYFGNIQPIDSL